MFVLAGLLVALVLAVVVSRFASSAPDGLETVAASHGLDGEEAPHALADSPFADHSAPGVDDEAAGGGAAGVLGVAVSFAAAAGLVAAGTAWARRRRPARHEGAGPPAPAGPP